jgi:hypothetical protein
MFDQNQYPFQTEYVRRNLNAGTFQPSALFSLLAVLAGCFCSFFAFDLSAQDVIWSEYFNGYAVDYGITTSVDQSFDQENGKWAITTVNCDYFKKTTSSGYIETTNAFGIATWTSEVIATDGYTNLEADIRIKEIGDCEESGSWIDYYRVSVSYDGGTNYSEIGYDSGNFEDVSLDLNLTVSATIRLKIELRNTSDEEQHRIYRVVLRGICNSSSTWYADGDGDGFGDVSVTITDCGPPSGYVSNSTDCDDTSAANNPNAIWYADDDGDGYGDANDSQSACSAPSGYVSNGTDCNDNDAAINPGATESCDGVDNDCDSNVDEGVLITYYRDADGDSYGDSDDSQGACSAPSGYVANSADCDDSDANINPGAPETCDGTDNNCSGDESDATDATTWYADADDDGLGDPATTLVQCSQPSGYVSNSNDVDVGIDNDDYEGTVLYPGDVYFSYGTDGEANAGNKQEAYVGFVLLKEVAEGTTVVLSPKLKWKDNKWSDEGKMELEWTAPTGGVAAGTEVILFDIRDNSATGTAYCSEANDPIVATANEKQLTGGAQCGNFTQMGSERHDFRDKDYCWLFQPNIGWDSDDAGDTTYDSKCRHLNCVGENLDDGDNTGTGTLIVGGAYSAQMSSDYSYQNDLFKDESWSYNGGTTYSTFAANSGDLVTSGISEGVSFSANGETPAFTSEDTDKKIKLNPNGSIGASSNSSWSAISSNLSLDADFNPTQDITIDEDVSLVIDVTDVVACNDITLSKGTFQSCDGQARTVSVAGNVSVGSSATFNGGQGTLRMAGSSDQIFDADNYATPASDKVQLKNLKIEESKLTVKGHVKLKPGGSLQFDDDANVSADKIEIDTLNASSLTFQSTSEGTAAVGACEASNFDDGTSQEFTFERFIPADTDNSWVNIAPYVTGTTVANWTDSISGMLIFKYNETSFGSIAAGWEYLWDPTEVLVPGTGYMALVPANTSGTLSVSGAFQIGQVVIALTFSDDPNQSNTDVDGWNLVSNPYPAPVNLPQVLADNDLVESYYVFDNTGAGSYKETDDAGTGDAPSVLDVGQSFWVKVTEATTITFDESDKVTNGSNTFIREFDPGFEGSLGLHVENEQDQWSNAFIGFHEEATPDFVNSEDAIHLDTELLNQLRMWTVAETGEHLAIQSLGSVATTPSVPLHMTTGAGGDITFELFEQDLMPENYCMLVEDTETGEKAQMGVETLTVNVPAETLYEGRFVVHFNAMPAMELTSTTCDGLDIEELEGDWEAWDVAWESTDGEMSGDAFPDDLPNGDYIFTYANATVGCANAIPIVISDACLGDFNENGTRDITDLMVLLAGMPGSGGASTLGAEVADCNCDGAVTIEDMLTFLSVFSSDCAE